MQFFTRRTISWRGKLCPLIVRDSKVLQTDRIEEIECEPARAAQVEPKIINQCQDRNISLKTLPSELT